MKRLVPFIAAMVALVSIPFVIGAMQEEQEEQSPVKTLTGEPIDIQCYMADSGRVGDGHATCAGRCAERGLPVGFLVSEPDEEGTMVKNVYLVLGAGDDAPKDLMADHFGKQVKATGKVTVKAGIRVISVEKVEAIN